MKSLNVKDGGMPFKGGSLMWLQEGLREGILAAVTPFLKDDRAVIANENPLNISPTLLIWESTWVVLEGELLYVPFQQISSGNESLYGIFKKELYNDPSGQFLYEDGLTKDSYDVSEGEILLLSAGSGEHIPLSDLDAYLPKFLTHQKHTLLDEPGKQLEASIQGNIVTIQGVVDSSFSATLPVIYRPSYDIRVNGYATGEYNAAVTVRSTGQVVNEQLPSDSDPVYYNVTYFV